MAELKFTPYKPTEAEKYRRGFLEERLNAMDSAYHRACVAMARLGRDATDGLVTDGERVSNSEIIKIPISHAVVMQRLATLADNPSRAIYKTPKRDKSKLAVAEQLNEYDKIVGRYDAVSQNIARVAETEGACVFKQGWYEDIKKIDGKLVTVGKMFTSQEPVLVENFFWDPSANELRGETGIVANDAMDRRYSSLMDFRVEYANDPNYKNVLCVQPMDGQDVMHANHVWSAAWQGVDEQGNEYRALPGLDKGRQVIIWSYCAKNFYDPETGTVSDVLLEYANGVEIRKDKINVPAYKGKKSLPYGKIVCIPTGGMWGISMPAIIRHPEKCLQRMVTMADAQAEIAVNPVTFMSSAIYDALENRDLFPGSKVEVSMQGRTVADEVYIHQNPDITNGAQYIIDKMLHFIAMVSGVDVSALFESPKTKAISTERKREIQERLLRYSVIHNENHGYFDMEELRLLIMLKNYPVKRWFLDMGENGKETVVERYPQIPVDGFSVKLVDADVAKSADDKQFVLKKSPKAFDLLTVNPASIEYNVHLYIEGATQAANDDSFKLNKALEKLQVLEKNPWTGTTIDPRKASSQVYRILNLDENDFIREELEKTDVDLHGAMKEIQALMLKDVQPIEIKVQDDYEPKEYTDVFMQFIATKEFKGLSATVKQGIMERYTFHVKNSLNPYYKEELAKAQEAQKAAEAQAAAQNAGTPGGQVIPTVAPGNVINPSVAGGGTPNQQAKAAGDAMVEPPNPMEMTQRTDSKAGRLGQAGKGRAALSKSQRKTLIA